MSMTYTRGYTPERLIRSLYARLGAVESEMDLVAHKGAEAIKDLSVALVPVDEGHVEDAHRVEFRSTRKGHVAYDVVIDETEADIAEYIHELNSGFMRGKEYALGPLSQQKADLTGMDVGPKFLERAFDRLRPSIVAEYRAVTKKFVR